jgi:hypothetical protein
MLALEITHTYKIYAYLLTKGCSYIFCSSSIVPSGKGELAISKNLSALLIFVSNVEFLQVSDETVLARICETEIRNRKQKLAFFIKKEEVLKK